MCADMEPKPQEAEIYHTVAQWVTCSITPMTGADNPAVTAVALRQELITQLYLRDGGWWGSMSCMRSIDALSTPRAVHRRRSPVTRAGG